MKNKWQTSPRHICSKDGELKEDFFNESRNVASSSSYDEKNIIADFGAVKFYSDKKDCIIMSSNTKLAFLSSQHQQQQQQQQPEGDLISFK